VSLADPSELAASDLVNIAARKGTKFNPDNDDHCNRESTLSAVLRRSSVAWNQQLELFTLRFSGVSPCLSVQTTQSDAHSLMAERLRFIGPTDRWLPAAAPGATIHLETDDTT